MVEKNKNYMIIFSGTSFVRGIESILTKEKHFFYDPQSIDFLLVDTQKRDVDEGKENIFSPIIGDPQRGKDIFTDINGRLNEGDLLEIANFIRTRIENNDRLKIREYKPSAGGAGTKWEGGVCAYFSLIDVFHKRFINFLSKAGYASDIIITAGAMGGTKSGMVIPMLFHLAYLLTSPDFFKGKNIRVHVVILLPDQSVIQMRAGKNYRENGNKLLFYVRRFIEYMKSKDKINEFVYFLRPAMSVNLDIARAIRFISLLTHEDIVAKIVDEPQHSDSNYFTMYLLDNYLRMPWLVDYMAYSVAKTFYERELKQNFQVGFEFSHDGSEYSIVNEFFWNRYRKAIQRFRSGDVNDESMWFNNVCSSDIIDSIVKIVENEFSHLEDENKLVSGEYLGKLLKLCAYLNDEKNLKESIEEVIRNNYIDTFYEDVPEDLKDEFSKCVQKFMAKLRMLKSKCRIVSDRKKRYELNLFGFETHLEKRLLNLKSEVSAYNSNLIEKVVQFSDMAVDSVLFDEDIEDYKKDILLRGNFEGFLGILKQKVTDMLQASDYLRLFVQYILDEASLKRLIEEFSSVMIGFLSSRQAVSPLHLLSISGNNVYTFLLSNYYPPDNVERVLNNLKQDYLSPYNRYVSDSMRDVRVIKGPYVPNDEKELVQRIIPMLDRFVFKIALLGIVSFGRLDSLDLVKSGFYSV